MIGADKILTEEQLARLLKTIRTHKERALAAIKGLPKRRSEEARIIMDYFQFGLIANTGLRISEALNLRWSDIHDDFLIVQAEVSKNGRKGTVYFGPKTKALLTEYRELKERILGRSETDLLFSFSECIQSRSYAHSRFKLWLRIADLPTELSIHSLRHTYGTICLDNGFPLTFVRDQLRHSNIAITSQYLHLTKASRDRVKELF